MQKSVIILGEDHFQTTMRKLMTELQDILSNESITYKIGYEGYREDDLPDNILSSLEDVHLKYNVDRDTEDEKFFEDHEEEMVDLSERGIVFPIDDKKGALDLQKDHYFLSQAINPNSIYAQMQPLVTKQGIDFRNKAMVRNTIKEINKDDGTSITILLCGAQHMKYIRDELKHNNIICTSVSNHSKVKADFYIKNDVKNMRGTAAYILYQHRAMAEKEAHKNYKKPKKASLSR
ncbi:hypothetical protein N9A04_00500 [Rickettsiales bacterium]|nr:hypothetical protein [Rickettsiales bacterium]